MTSYLASVRRVAGVEGFEADIDLGFGVALRKLVRIHRKGGVAYRHDGQGLAANHCLVILVGGKDVLLSGPREEGRLVCSDVYTTFPGSALPQVQVPGASGYFIDVYDAMVWASDHGWDARQLKAVLRP